MDPSTYLTKIVRPAFERYAKEPRDVSLLYSAVVLMYHTVDHEANSIGHSGNGVILKCITNALPEFEIVQALANAQKHAVYEQTKSNPHKGLRSEDIELNELMWGGQPATWGGEIAVWGPPNLKLPDGTICEIYPLVEKCFAYFTKRYGLPSGP